ncbi:MAG: division/cell wall cluster transcriptional repressor MraZ [Deltaproteobacteria bacterium]|nr:division/cell wall cluster transcriptional repressor MraZ [Deltaproteobacteria bacterium]
MFKGHFVNSINEKGRLSIPSKLREVIDRWEADYLIITKGLPEKCLMAFIPSEWEKIEDKARQLSMVRKAEIVFRRHVIGSAEECHLDAQGRILVPSCLREYAGLKRKCLFVGIIDRFEIWDQETYDKFMEAALEDEDKLREGLADLGL